MNAKWNCRLAPSANAAVLLVALLLLPLSFKAVSASDEPPGESKKTTAVVHEQQHKPDATEQDRYAPPTKTTSATTPERIRGGSRIFIAVQGAPPNRPIDAYFNVESGGTVPLGPTYGRVHFEGMTAQEAEVALTNHLKTMIKDPKVQITITNPPVRRQSEERISPQELEALREHVRFLQEQFKKIDALYQTAAKGGSADAWAMSGYELATAQCELALAQGHRDEAIAFAEQAVNSSEEAMKSTQASYEAGRLPLDLLLKTARYVSESKRRLHRLRNSQPSSVGGVQRTASENGRSQREVVPAAAAQGPGSVGMAKKIVESKKRDYERMQKLAQANDVSAAELEKARLDYEMSIGNLEHAKRNLRYAQLQLELAETELQETASRPRTTGTGTTDFELKKLQIKVEIAKLKLSDAE